MSSALFTEDLFSKVLLQPANNNVSDLYIVSGYASSAMAFHHSEKLKEKQLDIKIHLIIGMAGSDGLSKTNHLGFKNLMENVLLEKFECSYLINHRPVHSKVYSWLQGDIPIKGFVGSANYSQKAFIGNLQREVATECSSLHAYEYYKSLIDGTLFCTHQDAEELIDIYSDNHIVSPSQKTKDGKNGDYKSTLYLENKNVSLINRSGKISERSGLNWGQREIREPNQAYIPLKSELYRTDFFPPVGQHFTINTDDGKILLCSRAQQNGKAIHTPHNNSQLGEYFRNRLGVANGKLVTMDDLRNYGRTDIDFYKIDEENYFMDFSIKKST